MGYGGSAAGIVLSSAPPPAVALAGAAGTAATAARADHTHQSSVQAQRAQIALTNGLGTWTYPQAYGAGVTPVIQITAETPSGQTYKNDATIIQGSITNTSCQIYILKVNQSVTLPLLATSLLGFVVNIFSNQTGSVYVNCLARAPTA